MKPFTCAFFVSIWSEPFYSDVLLVIDVAVSSSHRPSQTPQDQIPLSAAVFVCGLPTSIIERPRLMPSNSILLTPSKLFNYLLLDLTQCMLRLIVLAVLHKSLLRE